VTQMTSDTAHIRIHCPPNHLFDFMSDPARLDLWSFGTWQTEIAADGLVRGTSLFNGGEIFLRIVAHRETGLVDYLLGKQPDRLVRRIFAHILPASDSGGAADAADLLLVALRSQDMDDTRWENLKALHAVEVRLIKQLIETGYDHRK